MIYNHQIIDELLDAITPIIPQDFGVITNCCEELEPVCYNSIVDKVLTIDPEAEVSFGMSKFVIIPSQSNVVIKIPFNGFYDETYEDDLVWLYFTEASGSIEFDYCQAEYEKYLKLKEYGLECFVAETFCYDRNIDFNIFLAEKVIPYNNSYGNSKPKPSKKSSDIASRLLKENRISINSDWIASCVDFYGEEKVEKFFRFCEEIDNEILVDMHDNNFGYRERDNSPCILDYSNFND